MSEVSVSITGLTEAEALIGRLVSPKARLAANKVGARAGQQALKKYHRDKGRKMWLVPGPTHGPGRRQTGWYRQVSAAWGTANVTADGAQLINGAQFFAHKVKGGVIKAKRVRFLTIPLIPQAHGHTARTYAQENSTKLFTIKGVPILFQKGGKGTQTILSRTAGRRRNGKRIGLEARTALTAVFALKKSVTQAPTPGALPVSEVYAQPYEVAMVTKLLED
jgi:hypothetical protein